MTSMKIVLFSRTRHRRIRGDIQANYEAHIRKKGFSRLENETDKSKVGGNFIVAVYDLQAVVLCPKGDVSRFYYASKLNVFDFTISELKTNQVNVFSGIRPKETGEQMIQAHAYYGILLDLLSLISAIKDWY